MPTVGNSKSLGSLVHDNIGMPAGLLSSGSSTIALASPKYLESSAIVILSDSTGIQPTATTGWPYKLAQAYAAAFPYAAVVVSFWNDATQDYDAPTNITANTQRYINIQANDGVSRVRTLLQADVGAYTDLDLRVDVAPTSWTPAASCALVGQWGGGATKNHRLLLRTDGKLELDFTLDGSTTISPVSSVATGFSAGVRKNVRVTRLASTGATNFYTRDPGTTAWTQLGSANVSSTSGAIASVTQDFFLGGSLSSNMIPGFYYGVEYRAAIDSGKIVNPQSIEAWYGNEGVSPSAGAPTLYIWVGAKSGADASYLTDATRGPKLVPPIWLPTIGMINNGHNQSTTETRSSYYTDCDGFKTLFTSQCPGAITMAMTQNPRTDGVEESHRRHMTWLRGWALKNAVPLVDVYGAFLKDTNSLATNLQVDGLHPAAPGTTLWANTLANRMIL